MKRNKVSLVLAVVFVFLLFGTNVFAFSPDSVLSHDIKEADGTSGQDTNTGSGIKTGHIQDGAVTTSKIIDGAVTTPKINDGAITDTKIGSNAVTTPKIADGAVTDAKITGPISGSKLGSHSHSGSDIADGSITTPKIAMGAITPDKIGFYRNVFIVAPSGGDFTNPVDAMNAITDASATNPYLVKIMPGVYDIGGSSVQMKEYVDIEGSGENNTKITGIGVNLAGVVRGDSNAEIRFLTVESKGGSGITTAIWNGLTSPKITNVTVKALCAANTNYGIYNGGNAIMTNVISEASGGSYDIGIYTGGAPVMKNVTAEGDSYLGLLINGGSPVITDAKINNGSAIFSSTSAVMRNVTIEAGIYNDGGYTVIMDSIIKTGSVVNSGGTVKCIDVYDGNYNPYTCP